MKKLASTALVSAALAFGSLSAQADTNVALNKTVTLSGTFYENSAGWGGSVNGAASTITDGIFLPNLQQWNVGTVWWNSAYTNNYIQIDLGDLYSINKLTLQADNNDLYRVQYLNQSNTWINLFDMNTPDAWGMTTITTVLGSSILASSFRISDGPGGDCCDSVSEFQAFGVAAVPEPESYAMMLAGLGLMGLVAKRRRVRQAA